MRGKVLRHSLAGWCAGGGVLGFKEALPRYNNMGQSQFDASLSKNTHLIDKLELIMYEATPFGELPVYRLTQKPYDYFLRYRHTYPATAQQALTQAHDLYLSLSSHRSIVRIDILQTQTTKDLCTTVLVLDAYARYHNYTLDHAILCKLHNRKMFTDADLLYIFISLVQVATTFAEVLGRNNLGVFRTGRIYLSTEGYIKVYPYQLNAQNLMTHQSLEETCNGSELEVPTNSKEPVRSQPYRSKTDLKDIAIVMTQLCLLQPDQHDHLAKESTRYRLEKGLSGRISPALRNILLHLLEGGDMPWSYLKEQLQLIKSEEKIRPVYCIRLQDNISLRESEILLRQNQEDVQKERHKMLQTVQMNLVPSRIEITSKIKRSHS